jgi:tetratricopeptide (TPR) repeat protein
VAFLAGAAMYGAFIEFRIFMQILPLSLMVLSGRWRRCRQEKETGGGLGQPAPEEDSSVWAVCKTFAPLGWLVVLLVGLSTVLVAWRYVAVLEKCGTAGRGGNYLVSAAHVKNLETASAWFKNARADAQSKLAGAFEPDERARLAVAALWFELGFSITETKLAEILQSLGRDPEAIGHYRIVMGLSTHSETNSVAVNNNLAWLFATASDPRQRNGKAAVELAEQACEATQYKEPFIIGTLAAAYAEAGRFDEAVVAGRKARELALALGQKDVAAVDEQLLKLYESGKPYHREAGPSIKSRL